MRTLGPALRLPILGTPFRLYVLRFSFLLHAGGLFLRLGILRCSSANGSFKRRRSSLCRSPGASPCRFSRRSLGLGRSCRLSCPRTACCRSGLLPLCRAALGCPGPLAGTPISSGILDSRLAVMGIVYRNDFLFLRRSGRLRRLLAGLPGSACRFCRSPGLRRLRFRTLRPEYPLHQFLLIFCQHAHMAFDFIAFLVEKGNDFFICLL